MSSPTDATNLPATRAFHGMATAYSPNSSVFSGTAYLYIIGGQAQSTDAPGGTDTVYITDSKDNAIRTLTPDGTFGTLWINEWEKRKPPVVA